MCESRTKKHSSWRVWQQESLEIVVKPHLLKMSKLKKQMNKMSWKTNMTAIIAKKERSTIKDYIVV